LRPRRTASSASTGAPRSAAIGSTWPLSRAMRPNLSEIRSAGSLATHRRCRKACGNSAGLGLASRQVRTPLVEAGGRRSHTGEEKRDAVL
jgi:hypothetical protein